MNLYFDFFFPSHFRLFLWRNWSKADFRTILISSSGLRSSLMPITMVKSMIQLQPDRVRMPFPHLTPVSRSLTCQRSPTMQPAPLLQVNLLSSTPFFCYPSICERVADMRHVFIFMYLAHAIWEYFLHQQLVTSKL